MIKDNMILVPIGKATQKRKNVKDLIGLTDFFDGIKTGRWKSEVSLVRKLDKDDPRYELQKKLAHAVWLQAADLMVFDYDHGKLDIPKKFILARCKSIGGTGEMIIMRTPSENREQYRRWIQYKYNFKDGQTSDDRCRFVSWDPDIKVNWKAEIDTDTYDPNWQDTMTVASSVDHKTLAPEYYQQAKDQVVPLDNTTALAVYSWLRHRSINHTETCRLLEECLFKTTGSMTTKQKRFKYYQKWSQQYETEFPIPIKQIKSVANPDPINNLKKVLSNTKTEASWYCSDQEQVDIMLQTAIGPYVPLHIRYFNSDVYCCSSTMLVGESGSGKGYINSMLKPLFNELNNPEFDAKVYDWIINKHSETVFVNMTVKAIEKAIPNLFLISGFSSSDAAIFGSLSEIKIMLLYGNEFSSFIGSLRNDYNSSRLGNLLELVEGETIMKTLKKSEAHGKSKFSLSDYRFGMLSGGTPEVVNKFFGNNILNGFAARVLFLPLRNKEVGIDKDYHKYGASILKHVTANQVFEFIESGYKSQEVKFDEKYFFKQRTELEQHYKDTPIGISGVLRGTRDCLKRAACQLWIDGERKNLYIDKGLMSWQFNILERSLDYVNSFSELQEDRFGSSLFDFNAKTGLKELAGNLIRTAAGKLTDPKIVSEVIRLYQSGISITDISKATKISRPTIYNWVK